MVVLGLNPDSLSRGHMLNHSVLLPFQEGLLSEINFLLVYQRSLEEKYLTFKKLANIEILKGYFQFKL